MGFIKKLIAFDEVMDNAYGMISTANFVVVLHRDEGTTQSSTVLGGSGSQSCSMLLWPLSYQGNPTWPPEGMLSHWFYLFI